MLPSLKKSYRLDPVKDFTPVALVASSWTVFAVNPKVPANTLAELIAYSKANPGKVRYGSGGVGGALHIAVEMLRFKTGADLVHVPYRGGGQAASDAVSGQIEMVSLGLASARIAEGGALRVLAQTGPRRHPMFADVPTTAELDLPDVRMDTWFGLMAPPNTPDPVVSQLARAIETGLQQQSFREKLFRIGCDVAWKSPADFTAFMSADRDKWSKLIPAMGISLAD
jgi:tripartite-type tricarboxylate transporter receptor subunit TctC